MKIIINYTKEIETIEEDLINFPEFFTVKIYNDMDENTFAIFSKARQSWIDAILETYSERGYKNIELKEKEITFRYKVIDYIDVVDIIEISTLEELIEKMKEFGDSSLFWKTDGKWTITVE